MADPETIPQMFQASVHRRGEAPALKAKLSQGGWRTITWQGFGRYAHDLASFLMGSGVRKGDRVAILMSNCPEWAVGDLGILHAGGVSVPIYETLAADKVAHILRDSGARIAVAGTRAQAEELLRHVPGSDLEMVLCVEPTRGALGKQVVDWKEALARGADLAKADPEAFARRWQSVQPDDLASLIYTSGTTGEPKGVMLSHHNFVSNVAACYQVMPLEEGETFLSFLPLSHSLERMAGHYFPIRVGALIVYAESIEKLPENLVEVRPTVMTSVPRLFEKMWARVEAGAREQGKEKVLHRALEVGREYVRITRAEGRTASFGLKLKYRVFDQLVFSKVRARVGGQVKYFVSGGAHIREDLEWNLTAVGLPVLGGYGLTESSPVISVNTLDHWRPGSVGKPVPGVEVRVLEDGEILARGPNIMRGYFNKPEESRATVDEEGWLHTGDIGHVDADGYLYVTDRKKELFKTSGGKYVAPQPIEDLLRGSPLIAEAVTIGDDRHFVSALLIPDLEALTAWAKEHGVPTEDRAALVAHPQVRQAVQAEVDKVNAKLSRFETIKRWTLLDHEFTQEAGMLTPSLKVKRRVVDQMYADAIETMYKEGPPAGAAGGEAQAAPELASAPMAAGGPGSVAVAAAPAPEAPPARSRPAPVDAGPLGMRMPSGLTPTVADQPVLDLEGVGATYAAKLNAQGVEVIEDLLWSDAASLAQRTGISEALLQKWQAMGHLQAVNGIGKQYSELLVRAGITTMADLAEQEPEALAKRLNDYEERLGVRVQGTVIDERRTADWVAQAKELAQRFPAVQG